MKEILIAEDDLFAASVYKLHLSREGFTINSVRDGEQALDFLKDNKPDLIILDILMPIIDGFDILKAMKTDSRMSSIKVLVVSNLAQEDDIKKAKDLGADDYMVKADVSIADIVAGVRKLLD